VIYLSPPPPAAHSETIGHPWLDDLAERGCYKQARKVDPSIDRELQRTPEAAIYFHQVRLSGRAVPLEFHHRHAAPTKAIEERARLVTEGFVDGDALAVHTDTAGRRFLAETPMGELSAQFPIPKEQENAYSGAGNALLHEEWKGGSRQQADLAPELVLIRRVRDRKLCPTLPIFAH
jgi:hypothetical protein